MKNIWFALPLLALAASSAGARASRGAGGKSFAGRSFSRPLSRPTFTRSSSRSVSHARSLGATTKKSFASSAPASGNTGGSSGSQNAPPAFATPGALIRTAGQPPVYSYPGASGTHSVEGGVIALDASKANDVGRGPGVTLAAPDRTSSGGSRAGGNGVGSNGPPFDPSF